MMRWIHNRHDDLWYVNTSVCPQRVMGAVYTMTRSSQSLPATPPGRPWRASTHEYYGCTLVGDFHRRCDAKRAIEVAVGALLRGDPKC